MSLQLTADSMSLTYIKKSKGPGMEPCGTPQGTSPGLEKVPFISTDWVLFIKYESNHETEISLSTNIQSLSDNKECFKVSKDFCRSIVKMLV